MTLTYRARSSSGCIPPISPATLEPLGYSLSSGNNFGGPPWIPIPIHSSRPVQPVAGISQTVYLYPIQFVPRSSSGCIPPVSPATLEPLGRSLSSNNNFDGPPCIQIYLFVHHSLYKKTLLRPSAMPWARLFVGVLAVLLVPQNNPVVPTTTLYGGQFVFSWHCWFLYVCELALTNCQLYPTIPIKESICVTICGLGTVCVLALCNKYIVALSFPSQIFYFL